WYRDGDGNKKYDVHDRSIGIELSYVDLDLVGTSAPSESQVAILTSDAVTSDDTPEEDEAQDWRLTKSWLAPGSRTQRPDAVRLLEQAKREPEWKTEPLYIPSRDLGYWEQTDPLAQIRWTWDKNRQTKGCYLGVVQALKWYRRSHAEPPYPKGYPLEHL